MGSCKQRFMAECLAKYRAAQLTPSDRAAVADMAQRVLDICSRSVNKAQLELFGSLATGFCTTGADADLSLTYRNFSPWMVGMDHVDERNSKRLARVAREAGEEGMEASRLIGARIPVVQFQDPVTSIRCDVTIGNLGGVQNSKILAEIHNVLPDFYGAYVYLVKEWGKRCEVVAPDKSTFNSFTITIMSLMVLQELGLLPVFVPSGDFGELTVADVQKALAGFRLPPAYDGIEQDDVRLGEALYFCFLRFAEYYSKFNFQQGTVSLMCPRRHRTLYADIVKRHIHLLRERKRQEWVTFLATDRGDREVPATTKFPHDTFEEAMRAELLQRQAEGTFVVEDFVNYVNCGRRVPASNGPKIHIELKRLYEQLRHDECVAFESVFHSTATVQHSFSADGRDPRVEHFATRR
ncbi:hypothetical protein NESM_000286800 [Novymonas esmeraldas]|uniref:RNA uridylyltransferase n=1 Tax=Novymonas esmeraldas TaxID=1808958 RepID=A0AAW0F9D6_9TRYP